MDIPHGGIGFFDSGLGGLTVLFACRGVCGNLPVYYYGDNARAPYGGLSPEIIKNYAAEAFDTFSALGVRAAVSGSGTRRISRSRETWGNFCFSYARDRRKPPFSTLVFARQREISRRTYPRFRV